VLQEVVCGSSISFSCYEKDGSSQKVKHIKQVENEFRESKNFKCFLNKIKEKLDDMNAAPIYIKNKQYKLSCQNSNSNNYPSLEFRSFIFLNLF
jgi:hypothetical protein